MARAKPIDGAADLPRLKPAATPKGKRIPARTCVTNQSYAVPLSLANSADCWTRVLRTFSRSNFACILILKGGSFARIDRSFFSS